MQLFVVIEWRLWFFVLFLFFLFVFFSRNTWTWPFLWSSTQRSTLLHRFVSSTPHRRRVWDLFCHFLPVSSPDGVTAVADAAGLFGDETLHPRLSAAACRYKQLDWAGLPSKALASCSSRNVLIQHAKTKFTHWWRPWESFTFGMLICEYCK